MKYISLKNLLFVFGSSVTLANATGPTTNTSGFSNLGNANGMNNATDPSVERGDTQPPDNGSSGPFSEIRQHEEKLSNPNEPSSAAIENKDSREANRAPSYREEENKRDDAKESKTPAKQAE